VTENETRAVLIVMQVFGVAHRDEEWAHESAEAVVADLAAAGLLAEPPSKPLGTYAHIHVSPEPGCDAWPVVERVPGGWQSGVHHYPDEEVLGVRLLRLADTPPETELARWMKQNARLADERDEARRIVAQANKNCADFAEALGLSRHAYGDEVITAARKLAAPSVPAVPAEPDEIDPVACPCGHGCDYNVDQGCCGDDCYCEQPAVPADDEAATVERIARAIFGADEWAPGTPKDMESLWCEWESVYMQRARAALAAMREQK
jgi:hypothetical protein